MIKELKNRWWAQDLESFDRYYRMVIRLRKNQQPTAGMERLCAAIQERWPNQRAIFEEIKLQHMKGQV